MPGEASCLTCAVADGADVRYPLALSARPTIMTSTRLRLATAVVLALPALACNRYEYRTAECPQVPRGIAASTLGWQATPTRNTIVVRARTAATADTIPASLVGARVDRGPWTSPGPDGAIHIESVATGRHVVAVRAFGYRIAVDTVVVQRDSGIAAVAVMSGAPITFDESCGFVLYRTRKPWWKLW